jgi:citrate synthase
VPEDLYTVFFAASRVSGWAAQVMEYLENNSILGPRSQYVGEFDREYVPLDHGGVGRGIANERQAINI